MEDNNNREQKKRLDIKKYEPIRDKDTIDLIMADMSENKIYPSDALKAVLLQRIGKVNVQKYLVEKFQETKDKIEHKINKRTKKETK